MQKQIVQTRWVLTWEMLGGKQCVEARLVAKGFQDPGLKDGLVDASGCVSLRSSHLLAVSLGAIRKWKLRSFDIKNAFLQADGFGREVFLQFPEECALPCGKRVWKLKAPAYGLNDAPAASRRSATRHLLNSELSVKDVGLRCQAPTFDPCFFLFFGIKGGQWVRLRPILMTYWAVESLTCPRNFASFRNNALAK